MVARFDAEHASTDGGALLLKALDERLALTEDLAACLPDRRDHRNVQHELHDLLRQYRPKGTDLAGYNQRKLMAIAHRLNARPRQCHNFATPREVSAHLRHHSPVARGT